MNDFAAPQTTGWIGLLDRVWRTLASPRLTVILFVWIAVVLTLSVVIPQAPPHVEDAIVRSQWLATVPLIARPLVERLQPLGVFNLLGSAWLRLPLALLLAHVMVILADWGPIVWLRAKGPLPASIEEEMRAPGQSFQLGASWPEPGEPVSRHIVGQLGKAGYCVLSGAVSAQSDKTQPQFVAWRRRWSWLALVGVYFGLGLVLLGLILAGWLNRVHEVSVEPDSPAPLPVTGAPNLVLDKVTVVGADPLRPAVGVASMHVLTAVGESQPLTLGLHRSRLVRGAWLTLFDLRPVAVVTATDAETGEHVPLQSFSAHTTAHERVRLPLTGNPEARFAGIPSKNVTLRVDYQTDKGRPTTPAFSLFFFRGAETQPSQSVSLDNEGEATFDGVRCRVTFDYDALLRANSTLWWIAVAAGWGILALSFIWLAVAPPVRVGGQVIGMGKGSRVTLTVVTVGDEQRIRQELQTLVAPDV